MVVLDVELAGMYFLADASNDDIGILAVERIVASSPIGVMIPSRP